jgi:hypothetical protein
MTPAPNTRALDEYMEELVRALHAAVKGAQPHLRDDPDLVDRAIRDCREILEVVLDGDVAAWLGGPPDASR